MSEAIFQFKDVFGRGNAKLGDVITFSLPAIDTCPGATDKCKAICYATKGFYTYGNVVDKLASQYDISKLPRFPEIAIDLLSKNLLDLPVRIHVSGDFYSEAYAKKWLKIIASLPDKIFWMYSRSWSIPKIAKVLRKISKLPNAFVWYSVDSDSVKPKNVPDRVRLAYVMTDDTDIPKYRPDLFFRDYGLRKTATKHINNVLICPVEQSSKHITQCDKCKICLTLDHTHRTTDRFASSSVLPMPSRLPLPVLVGA